MLQELCQLDSQLYCYIHSQNVLVNYSDLYKPELLASTTTAYAILRTKIRLTQCLQALLRAVPALVYEGFRPVV